MVVKKEEKNKMNIFNSLFKSKPLTPAQRLKKGEQVNLEEMCDYIRETLSEEEQDKFFADIQLSVFPVFVQKLLEFKDSGELSEADFFKHLREQTTTLNQLLEKKNENKKNS